MTLEDFLASIRSEVQNRISESLAESSEEYPFPEAIFARLVMEHLAENAMAMDYVECHYSTTIGRGKLRVSGYAVSEDSEQLDLFVNLYDGGKELTQIPDSETRLAAEQCVRFLTLCVEGKLASRLEETSDVFSLAKIIEDCYSRLDQIRIFVITDQQAKSKNFKPREVADKLVKLEVMDIERLYRHWAAGKPRDEIIADFEKLCGGPIPCIFVPGEAELYDYALAVIPGEALRTLYDRFGPRLLEANVRSYLSASGKVNRGIRDTLKSEPSLFLAYNNGIVLVADEAAFAQDGRGLVAIQGVQIVNGGQTTASIFFTKRKSPEVNLEKVRVPAKIIILRKGDPSREEALISEISRCANSQNSVRQSDLAANKPFHVEIEKLAGSTYCPDGVGRWFYERAAGSYTTLLMREGSTPARLQKIKASFPTSRKITKTDLAKYLNSWEQRPDEVCLGGQKNFERFLARKAESEKETGTVLPDVSAYKQMIAKAILFKETQRIVNPAFPPAHPKAQITAYVVALLSYHFGPRFDLSKVWEQQSLSEPLRTLIGRWAKAVDSGLTATSGGKMVSEWVKRRECWDALVRVKMPEDPGSFPELTSGRSVVSGV